MPPKKKPSKALVVRKKKVTPVKVVELEVVNDPINAVHRVVHTVGEAAKAITNLVDVVKPHIDRMRRGK